MLRLRYAQRISSYKLKWKSMQSVNQLLNDIFDRIFKTVTETLKCIVANFTQVDPF